MRDIITKEGYRYGFTPDACLACGGRCCTGESGVIHVNSSEMERMASFLQMDVDEFIKKYLYKNGYKYAIKERLYQGSYECLFYDREANGCSVYAARPLQCRTFPFWDYYKERVDELKQECPGIVDV